MVELIQNMVTTFFQKLWVDILSIHVSNINGTLYLIHIETNDSSILIWPHWYHADSLRRILMLISNNLLQESVQVKVRINHYVTWKTDKLLEYIESRVKILEKSSLREYKLPLYSPYERKKIHAYIVSSETPITTQSRWEGKERRLFLLKPYQRSKLSIDIEGDMI